MTQGFEMMDIIVDVENCLQVSPKLHLLYLYFHVYSIADCIFMKKQAYVGFASDINAVIVVFRGTQENR